MVPTHSTQSACLDSACTVAIPGRSSQPRSPGRSYIYSEGLACPRSPDRAQACPCRPDGRLQCLHPSCARRIDDPRALRASWSLLWPRQARFGGVLLPVIPPCLVSPAEPWKRRCKAPSGGLKQPVFYQNSQTRRNYSQTPPEFTQARAGTRGYAPALFR